MIVTRTVFVVHVFYTRHVIITSTDRPSNACDVHEQTIRIRVVCTIDARAVVTAAVRVYYENTILYFRDGGKCGAVRRETLNKRHYIRYFFSIFMVFRTKTAS